MQLKQIHLFSMIRCPLPLCRVPQAEIAVNSGPSDSSRGGLRCQLKALDMAARSQQDSRRIRDMQGNACKAMPWLHCSIEVTGADLVQLPPL